MKAVGARLPRYDGVGHVTGRTQYVDDVRVGRTLWVKALRSPHHHAAITKLDTSKATITVSFKSGQPRAFQIGTSQYNDSVRYALDTNDKHVYILLKKMLSGFEVGESIIHLTDPRGIDD